MPKGSYNLQLKSWVPPDPRLAQSYCPRSEGSAFIENYITTTIFGLYFVHVHSIHQFEINFLPLYRIECKSTSRSMKMYI